MLTLDECRVLVQKAVHCCQSWEELEEKLFSNEESKHKVTRETIRRLYEATLRDSVLHNVLNNITALCSARNAEFFSLVEDDGDPSIDSYFIQEASRICWSENEAKCDSEMTQLEQLRDVLEGNKKMKKQVNNKIRKLLNRLVSHFFSNSAEKEACRVIGVWLESGDMTLQQWRQWQEFIEYGEPVTLETLRDTVWETDEDDCHLQKLINTLEEIDKKSFCKEIEDQLLEMLKCYLRPPTFDCPTRRTLEIVARTIYTSEVMDKIIERFDDDDDLAEVRFHAADACIIDCDFENSYWHGKNLCIVSEKLIVQSQDAVIDVSGDGYPVEEVLQHENDGTSDDEDGCDGVDGDAGESSGNVAIVVGIIRGAHNLSIYLNGGNAENGSHGGNGHDGRIGKSVTREDIDRTCISYGSIYRTSWQHFLDWEPAGQNWKCTYRKWDSSKEYLYREYEGEDGRKIVYSLAGDKGYFYTTYDLYFLMEGSKGSMGGRGGVNGVGGEGGRKGDLQFLSLSTGKPMKAEYCAEQKQGRDGFDGICGKSGKAGSNGNEMVMIDRSAQEASKNYIGLDGKSKITLSHQYKASYWSRLDGYRKHVSGSSDCFVRFDSKEKDSIAVTKATENRTSSNRQNQSKTVTKATIAIDSVVSDFYEHFEGDAEFTGNFKGDAQEWQELEVEEEEVEAEETVQQEVSLVRTHVEDEGLHDWKSRAEQIHPEEVLERIDSESLDLAALSTLFEDIFRVVLPLENADTVRKINEKIAKAEKLASKSNSFPNGMSRAAFERFLENTKEKLEKKVNLSKRLPVKFGTTNVDSPSNELELTNGTLMDVESDENNIDDFSKKIDTSNLQMREELVKFFDQMQYANAKTDLLFQLYTLHTFLHKSKDIMEPFKKDDLNWAEPNLVKTHLESFLTAKEREKKEKGIKKKLEELYKKKEKTDKAEKAEEAEEVTSEKILSSGENADETKNKEENGGFLKSVMSYISSSSEGEAFKEVEKLMKKKEAKTIFESFQKFVNNNHTLKDQFSYIISSQLSHLANPCSIPQSVIQMYYLSARILDCNMQFYRYWQIYNKKILSPNDWWITEEPKMTSYEDFMTALAKPPGMPEIDSQMRDYMLDHGIGCSTYRHYIADEKKINIQVFRSSGFCQMRLVENINPHFDRIERICIGSDGKCTSLRPNLEIRKLRQTIENGALAISKLPLCSANEPSVDEWFNATFKRKIEEWMRALKVSMKSNDFLRMLHEIHSLRGCANSLNEWLFMLNTTIESVCNVGLSEKAISTLTLRKDGELCDVWLVLRVIASMKGRCRDNDVEKMRKRLEDIREPRLRALFGSKLHELELNDDTLDTLDILIKMLAHADDRVVELAGMKLHEWIDIAKCQKWNDFEPLLRRYGAVGYYIVFLDSKQLPESQTLREIIDRVAKDECYIFEKTISRLAYLISYKEVVFDDDYAIAVENMLRNLSNAETDGEMISQLCEINKQNVKKTNNIHLLVNEYVQNEILGLDEEKIRASLDDVFPKENRSLDDLIRLTINPQDVPERAKKREEEMKTVKEMIIKVNENKVDDDISTKLREVCDALESECNVTLRETQKIAVLSAIMSKQNLLSQVNTGEGKSYIIATLAIMRILLSGYKDTVDIVTSSSVLAQRDAKEMEKLYATFNIRVSHNCDEDIDKRKDAYKCAVVYGDITRFERDYLLHSFYNKNVLGSRTRCNAIVDEVDSMLLDNGSNMLYLSHTVAGIELLEPLFVFIHREIRKPKLTKKDESVRDEDSFSSTEIRRAVLRDVFGLVTRKDIMDLLEEKNVTKEVGTIWRLLSKNEIIDDEGTLRKFNSKNLKKLSDELSKECGEDKAYRILTMLAGIRDRTQEIGIPSYLHDVALRHLDEFITNAKKAMFLEPNVEYVVDLDHTGRSDDLNALITIIDRGTGTDLSTSQWSEGLHQFLQLKHACRLTPLSMKAVFVSNVSYLKGYERLNGFSGTLGSVEESKSLVTLYGADLVRIPTFKPKIFNENVPVLATSRKEWMKNVFDEMCDQVCARRSVLIICRSIAEVNEFDKEFEKLNKLVQIDDEICDFDKEAVQECIRTRTVYRREFDEFEFPNGFACKRLIISTNLAGRGTDIKLSEELIAAGGLHVIISFLPENSRIEDQAYGRAARCGQPGSGQIIALVEENSGTTTNIFQLKQFRDNAEVHRLRSLSDYYHYHIEVEEKCLDMFRSHCSHVLEQVYSGNNEASLPSKPQVIYFALLDEWADWVDSKTEDIKECEKSRSLNEKTAIINKVNVFLNKHPLPGKEVSIDKAIEWIRTPQPLITLALIDIESEREHDEANVQLDKVANSHPYFLPEARYYQGVIAQQKIRQLKSAFLEKKKALEWKDEAFTWYNPLHYLQWGLDRVVPVIDEFTADVAKLAVDDIRNTPEWLIENSVEQLLVSFKHLLHARGMLSTRMKRKAELKHLVTMLQNTSTTVKSNGYTAQCNEATVLLETLIGNIDDMIGHTVNREDVRRILGEGAEYERQSVEVLRALEHSGIVSEVSLSRDISYDQLQVIARSHAISVTTQAAIFKEIESNGDIAETLQGEKIVSSASLLHYFSMPSALGFWRSISRAGCFMQEASFVAIHKSKEISLFKDKNIPLSNYARTPFTLQLSTRDLKDYNLYSIKNVAEVLGKNSAKNIQLEEHLTAGNIFIELIGELNPIVVSNDVWLDEFDYISVEDVARQLNLPRIGAEWIVQTLVKSDVLFEVEANRISSSTDSGFEDENSEKSEDAAKELPSKVYRLKDRVSCEMFPRCMQLPVQRLLARQFSYGYTLRGIRSSIMRIAEEGETRANSNDKKTSLSIVLPEQPVVDLYNDMLAVGILQRQRVTQTLEEVYGEDHGLVAKVREAFLNKKPRILVNKSTLTPTSTYFNEKCAPIGSERSRLIANGMRAVATVEKPNPWRYYRNLFIMFLPLAIIAVGIASLFVTPIVALIAVGVLAAVGTTLFCIDLFVSMQSAAAVTNVTVAEEFNIIHDCHQIALKERRAQQAEKLISKAIGHSFDTFIESCATSLLNGSVVTESEEEVEYATLLIEECCTMESEHLPMLREGISGFIIKATNEFQTRCFDVVNELTGEEDENELHLERKLRNYLDNTMEFIPPSGIFAFASLLLADVNSKLKLKKQPKLRTILSYDEYQEVNAELAEQPNSLSNVLATSLKKLVNALLEEETLNTIQPAAQRLSSLLNDSRVEKGSVQPDAATLKMRSQQHSSEQLLRSERTVDILSTDLHRIFLRIAFHSLTPQLLAHMVYYNYPLSAHCATMLFDSTIYLLKEIGVPLDQVDILLKRGQQNIVYYSAIFSKTPGKKKLILRLEDGCFYTVEKAESVSTSQIFPNGLFQELRNKFPEFADRYILDSTNFMHDLARIVERGKEAPEFWKRKVVWHADEKLLCSVAI